MIFGIWMATISMRKPVQMMVVLQLLNQMMQVVAILTLGHTRAVLMTPENVMPVVVTANLILILIRQEIKDPGNRQNDINCNNRNVVDGGGETSGDDSSKQS